MNAIKDVMMNKVLAGEAGKEKAREWGRWLATDEGQAYLAAQMDADFFEERENIDDGICEESRKGYSAICKRKFREDVLPD